MIVNDTERQAKVAGYAEQDKQASEAEARLAADRHLVLKEGVTGTKVDPLPQFGRTYTHVEFELKLLPLLPARFHIADHPSNPAMRWIWEEVRGADGQTSRLYVTAYYRGVVPEKSIFYAKENIRPVSGIYRDSLKGARGQRASISSRDMPKMVHKDNPDSIIGYDLVPESGNQADLPGWTKDIEMGSEKIRGWRTILIYLIANGAISLTQAENTFGPADTPEWAGHTGKAPVSTKW